MAGFLQYPADFNHDRSEIAVRRVRLCTVVYPSVKLKCIFPSQAQAPTEIFAIGTLFRDAYRKRIATSFGVISVYRAVLTSAQLRRENHI